MKKGILMESDWNEWSKYVLKELERLNSCYTDMNKQLGKIREDIASLQVKSGIWGLVGGCVPVLIIIVIQMIKK